MNAREAINDAFINVSDVTIILQLRQYYGIVQTQETGKQKKKQENTNFNDKHCENDDWTEVKW